MRKILSLFTLSLFAVSTNAKHVDIGLHGGVGTTWLFNNNISDQGANLDEVATFAPLIGLHFQYAPSKTASLYMEFNYAPVVQKYKGSQTSGSVTLNATGKEKLNYFSIPILLQLRSPSGF